MSIGFNLRLKKAKGGVRYKGAFSENSTSLMTWWYCGIYKNRKAGSQPNVLVEFREISESGTVSEKPFFQRVPLTALGQFRVGSVWQRGIIRSEAQLDIGRFTVDFDLDGWTVDSFNQSRLEGRPPPFPRSLYPLQYASDKNWLLVFRLPTGGRLVIPCLEFFYRCYGSSAELKRVLATYPWPEIHGGQRSRLFLPLGEPEESGKWKVNMPPLLRNGDEIFLAHAKYDSYTRNIAKRIYAQIESNFDTNDKVPAFIKVAPWFRDFAELKVKGLAFDNGRSFLGLQVLGCSDPAGVPISQLREYQERFRPELDESNGNPGATLPERRLTKLPEIIDLAGDREPDHGALTVEIQDPDFEVLGEPREVSRPRKKSAQGSLGGYTPARGREVDAVSSGESFGSGKSTGYASISAKPVLESQGVLRDMWNAMLYLSSVQVGRIKSVEWFTFDDGFSSQLEPKLIGLTPFDDAATERDNIPNATRNWLYMNPQNRCEVRGVLVTRLSVSGQYVYIAEIQRRARTVKDSSDNKKLSEEAYKGLVFVLEDQSEFESWLRSVLAQIRHVKGVVQRLVGECPGYASAFKHNTASTDRVPCESSVLNALNKVMH